MDINFDAQQQNVLREIQRNLALMCADNTRKSALSLFTRKTTHSGIYLYGDVGRGKTTLIKHIFDQLHITKQRYHCDTFFAELHRALQSKDINTLADDIHHQFRVIWIDELQIYDIATAMLLRRLIPALIAHHVIVLMTGNIAPEDFYKGGLNREQFADFIPYFQEHFYCLPLDGAADYRLQPKAAQEHAHAEKNSRFLLASPEATCAMEKVFDESAHNEPPAPFSLQLNHRTWTLNKTHESAVLIDFASLAEFDQAFDDYRELVKTFSTIFVTDVPIFNSENRDACRRFMAFIDIIYDSGATLYMSAYASPHQLYQDPVNKLPFARTASRLGEML